MTLFFSIGIILIRIFDIARGVAPTIDVSHNMRILKLPEDTKVGTIIYRLRGFDPDNDILTFGVRGDVGNQLLDIQKATETKANVFLKSQPSEKEYQLTIYVTDGVQTTEVESTIIITNTSSPRSPFIEYTTLISVSESAEEGDVISTLIVRNKNNSRLPVLFEVEGSDKFAINYVISPLKEASKAEMSIVQKLNYERQNLFKLTIFALNPWTDEEFDTRNVATVDLLVAVRDEQDTPPIFSAIPPVIRVSDSLNLGDNVTRILAEDGDYGNQRNVSYSFVPGSPGISYFNINSRTGMITLASSIEKLREAYSTSGPFILIVQATEIETAEIPGRPMSSNAHVAVVLVNTENRPPRFFNRRYVGTVVENSPELTAIVWEGAVMPKVIDDDQGKNGSFELFLEGDGAIFSVQPARGMNELTFAILVKKPEDLDYETSDTKYIEFSIVAKETASLRPLSASAEIRIKLIDANDNIPQFTYQVYNVTLREDAPPGTLITKIQATDEDTGNYGEIRYTAVNGPIAGNIRLDPVTGDLTLLSGSGLDRERIPEYTLTVEARDDLGKGNRNTAEVKLTLADANDNEPIFLQPRYDGVLNPDMKNFYEKLQVQAYDADGPGRNSDITYEIISGNYQEKFLIDPKSGEISLREPLVTGPDVLEHGLPVITLTIRAHDQGVPVKFSTVKAQIHNQEYLNRSISFVVPLSLRMAFQRRQELERGLSALTGAHVNVHSVNFHNTSADKSVVRSWVSYPLSSTVDLTNLEGMVSNIFGREYYISTTKMENLSRESFDVVFWLLIALVILMILAILALLFYCCCIRPPEGHRELLELKNKIGPEENVITFQENGHIKEVKDARRRSNSLSRDAWSASRRSQHKDVKRSLSAVDVDVQTSQPQTAIAHKSSFHGPAVPNDMIRRENGLPPRDYYQHEGIPTGRMERAYRQGRPVSPNTEMLLREVGGQDVRRVGDYMVVRKVINPRVRARPDDPDIPEEPAEDDTVPKRTEILYIRSPLKDEEDDRNYERMRIAGRDGDHQLRSVSETALNTMDQEPTTSTLRIPRAAHRQKATNLGTEDGPQNNQQLKFSRYHRTDSDVYLTSDGQIILGPNETIRTFHPRDDPNNYERQVWPERWETEELYQRPQHPSQRFREVIPEGDVAVISRTLPAPQAQSLQQRPFQTLQASQLHQGEHFQRAPHRDLDYSQESAQLPHHHSHINQPHHGHQQRVTYEEQIPYNQRQQVPHPQSDSVAPTIQKRGEYNPETQLKESVTIPTASTAETIVATAEDYNQQRRDSFHNRAQYSEGSEEFLLQAAQEISVDDEIQAEEEEVEKQDRPQTVVLNGRETKILEAEILKLPEGQDLPTGKTDQDDGGLLRATTEDDLSRTDHNPATDPEGEDSDSGIGKDGSGLRLKKANLMEKKSLFTIAYDGMQTRGLKSAGDRDDSP